MSQTRKWSLLAALLVVVVLVAGWFLVVSPKRSDAAALREQTTAQDAANDHLQLKIAQLQSQAKDLPAQRARLAELQTNIPNDPQLPALIRAVTAAGRASGNAVVSLTPGQPAAVTPAAGTGTASATTASGTLMQIPVGIDVTGTYFEVEQFLNKVEGLPRSFLVSGLSVSTGDEAAGPEAVKATITGRVFLNSTAVAAATSVPSPTPAPAN